MLRRYVPSARVRVGASLALMSVLGPAVAQAQAPAAAPPAPVEAAAPEPPAPVAPDPVPADAPPPTATPESADVAALSAKVDKLQQALDELKAQQDEAAATAAESAASSDDAADAEPLKIYGFTDAGLQHVWINEASPLAHIFQVNNTSFVVGNINLYFDAQPIKHFRALTELRFTNSPLGDIVNYGGLAGNFQRKDTLAYDPAGTAVNAPMWGGTVILERAWVEWNEHQALKLRVGNYFTPFGIWNVDHGTPTLISLALPQFIVQRWIPIRQTGVMLYGNAFAGDWELGYAATLSNGRQEISAYNFDNNFGVGGRVYARRDMGRINTGFGLSYFTGKTRDNRIDVVAAPETPTGIGFVDKTTMEYTEHVMGADASVDIDATRIRAEAVVRRLVYTPGHRHAEDMLFGPGSFSPDAWQQMAYLLVANQLPWGGIEPYFYGEVEEQPTIIGDLILVASAGVNVHFNPSVQWKTQVTRAYFTSWLLDSPYEPSTNSTTALYSRMVLAF